MKNETTEQKIYLDVIATFDDNSQSTTQVRDTLTMMEIASKKDYAEAYFEHEFRREANLVKISLCFYHCTEELWDFLGEDWMREANGKIFY